MLLCCALRLQAPEMVRVPLEELVLQIHLLRLGRAGAFLARVLQVRLVADVWLANQLKCWGPSGVGRAPSWPACCRYAVGSPKGWEPAVRVGG